MRNLVTIALAVFFTACNSAPKPPTVNGYNRSAVNSSETSSALSLKAELVDMEQYNLDTQLVILQPQPISQTVIVNFPFNSADFQPSASQEAALLTLLEKAQRIQIRGRTDGLHSSEGDEQIAIKRAQAAMNYVVSKGVPAAAVSLNFLSAGDYIADNNNRAGRATNRRVEIEIFNP